MADERNPRRDGFTLVELLVVIAIIGILISLILVAAADGVRRAEERQTQALIAKLENALTDRVDALLGGQVPVNQTHRYLAAITYSDVGPPASGFLDPIGASIDRRAQVIAQFDYMKSNLPDVFFVNNQSYIAIYPLNFAAAPYPLNGTSIDNFAVPLGNRSPGLPYIGDPAPGTTTPTYNPTPGFNPATGFNDAGVPSANLVLPLQTLTQDYGVFGASFTAASGLYKNLYESAALDLNAAEGTGFTINTKAGYDAADNGGIVGYIDDLAEVTVSPAPATPFSTYVGRRLARHTHRTARSEMLYALLVESQGPQGSVFNREDFTNRDVDDTDGDGLPEFIDAWGQPLQFYRWPILYGSTLGSGRGASDSQMNFQPYNYSQPRQLDPLDPNQLLVSIGWWTSINPGLPHMITSATPPDFSTSNPLYSSSPASQQANAFMTYFHTLFDPFPLTSPDPTSGVVDPTTVKNWDRTSTCLRRAYYSKFLVLSGGPDTQPGVFQLNKDYANEIDSTLAPIVSFPTNNPINDTVLLNWCESQAAPVDYLSRVGNRPFFMNFPGSPTTTYLQANAGLDDITNHSLSAPGSGAK